MIQACDDSSGPGGRPVISSLEAVPPTVAVNRTAAVTCRASDPAGTLLTYHWSAAAGALSGEGPEAVWTAPDAGGVYYISVTAENGSGRRAADSVLVTVVTPGYTGDAVKAVVLRSTGTGESSFWNHLNAEWDLYGSKEIMIDFGSFAGTNISYMELLFSGADLLIISSAGDPGGQPYTETEIEAFIWYVMQGHGLFVTGSSLGPSAHQDLAPLLGFSRNISAGEYFISGDADSVDIVEPGAVVLVGISSYTTVSNGIFTTANWDGDGDIGHPGDWQAIVTNDSTRFAAFLWNDPFSTLRCTSISYLEETYYSAVFAGHAHVAANATEDDFRFVYNAILFCSGK